MYGSETLTIDASSTVMTAPIITDAPTSHLRTASGGASTVASSEGVVMGSKTAGANQPHRLAQVAGVETVAQMVTEEIERHHGQENEDAGDENPRIAREVLHILRLRQQIAPTRGRLLDTQAEQGERTLAQDEARNRQRRGDDRIAEHRGDDMKENHARARSAQGARCLDVG